MQTPGRVGSEARVVRNTDKDSKYAKDQNFQRTVGKRKLQICMTNIYGSHPVVVLGKETKSALSNTKYIYFNCVIHVYCRFRPPSGVTVQKSRKGIYSEIEC